MKKDFIVRRSITMVEGKPHVETYSAQELIRCKDCKWHYETTRCHYYKAYYEDYDDPSEAKPSDNFYCADGVRLE